MPFTEPAAVAHPAAGGQHRRPPGGRPRLRRAVDLVAGIGGLVSLASLLVLGVAVAGAVDGVGAPRPGAPTVTMTVGAR